jgi:hypothetical protein
MLLLTATTDKIQVITDAAATVDVHGSFMDMSNADPPVVKGSSSGRTNTAITTATTTDVVAAPASSTVRNVKTLHVRNKDTAITTNVTVQFNQNGTLFQLYKALLIPGAQLEYVEGIGFFVVNPTAQYLSNNSTSSQTPFSSDTYLAGSSINVPANAPLVGTAYRLWFDVTKTAAGTATPIISIRYGTAGTTSDTAVCTLTFGAGTAAADSGLFEIHCDFRTVGSGTSAVLQAIAGLSTNLTTTGISNAVKAKQSTSSGFNSTVANSIIGASYNGGASAAHTIQLVRADLIV